MRIREKSQGFSHCWGQLSKALKLIYVTIFSFLLWLLVSSQVNLTLNYRTFYKCRCSNLTNIIYGSTTMLDHKV